jgi:hypothetical protein
LQYNKRLTFLLKSFIHCSSHLSRLQYFSSLSHIGKMWLSRWMWDVSATPSGIKRMWCMWMVCIRVVIRDYCQLIDYRCYYITLRCAYILAIKSTVLTPYWMVYVTIKESLLIRYLIIISFYYIYISLTLYLRRGGLRYSLRALTFYQNDLAMRNTSDVTSGKPIAVWSQSISGLSAVNLLSHRLRNPWKEGKGAILLLCPGHHTRLTRYYNQHHQPINVPTVGAQAFLMGQT